MSLYQEFYCKFGKVRLYQRNVDPLNRNSGLEYIIHKHGASSRYQDKSKFHPLIDITAVIMATIESGCVSPFQPQLRTGVRYQSQWSHVVGLTYGKPTCTMEIVVLAKPVLHIVNG
jgi:hypothetical protein